MAENSKICQEELAEARKKIGQIERRLMLQERTAGIGGLMAGIAHELNNPISYVCRQFQHSCATLC